ncbi:MAG: hypothetical protein CTY19_07285 [Methylomonas sp.]|nr:MAG: hypothetical protein CTY19_07285 [Methylomonas sp.]
MKTIWLFPKTLFSSGWQRVRFTKQNALPQSVSLFALLYLAWVLFSWPQLPGIHSPVDSALGVQSASTVESVVLADYLQIAEWQLMGQDSRDSQDSLSTAALTATPLQLKLLGTFFLSQQPHNNYAVIQSAEGMQKKYRLGESLQEGASLHAVEKNRVVLKHNQQLEYLAFDPNNLAVLAPQD